MCRDLSQVLELQWWTEEIRLLPSWQLQGRRERLTINKAANRRLISEGVECNEANKRGVRIESDE